MMTLVTLLLTVCCVITTVRLQRCVFYGDKLGAWLWGSAAVVNAIVLLRASVI